MRGGREPHGSHTSLKCFSFPLVWYVFPLLGCHCFVLLLVRRRRHTKREDCLEGSRGFLEGAFSGMLSPHTIRLSALPTKSFLRIYDFLMEPFSITSKYVWKLVFAIGGFCDVILFFQSLFLSQEAGRSTMMLFVVAACERRRKSGPGLCPSPRDMPP